MTKRDIFLGIASYAPAFLAVALVLTSVVRVRYGLLRSLQPSKRPTLVHPWRLLAGVFAFWAALSACAILFGQFASFINIYTSAHARPHATAESWSGPFIWLVGPLLLMAAIGEALFRLIAWRYRVLNLIRRVPPEPPLTRQASASRHTSPVA